MKHPNKIGIISRRMYEFWPSMQIVYEWEDCLQKHFDRPMKYYGCKYRLLNGIYRRIQTLLYHISYPFMNGWIHKRRTVLNKYLLSFELSPEGREIRSNKPNIIPVIIDYHWREKKMKRFENKYSRAPFVLINSREVYEYLTNQGCRIKLYHWPLSLPDQYKIAKDDWHNRPYDLVLMGRQNAVLKAFLDQYCTDHPKLTYLYSVFEKGTLNYYSNHGEYVATVWNREDYWKVLKMGKAAFHSTPGIDGGEKRTLGFNQVTPKGFEILAAGCNILMRYALNPDTEYHEYPKYFSNVQSYKDFEQEMERCMNTPPDYTLYQEYLDKHYTSTLVPLLDEIFSDFASKDTKDRKIEENYLSSTKN